MKVTITDPEHIFLIADNLANNEKKLFESIMDAAYKRWLEIASSNIVNKLDGLNEDEKIKLKVVLCKEILPKYAEELITSQGVAK